MAKHWWDKFLLKEESKERVLLVDHFIENEIHSYTRNGFYQTDSHSKA